MPTHANQNQTVEPNTLQNDENHNILGLEITNTIHSPNDQENSSNNSPITSESSPETSIRPVIRKHAPS